MASYRKTKDGQWVVCGSTSEVRVGTVTVTKASGETKQEQVVSLGKPFETAQGPCVYGYLQAKATQVGASPAPASRPTRTYSASRSGKCRAPGCSAPAVQAGYCKQCYFDEYDC